MPVLFMGFFKNTKNNTQSALRPNEPLKGNGQLAGLVM